MEVTVDIVIVSKFEDGEIKILTLLCEDPEDRSTYRILPEAVRRVDVMTFNFEHVVGPLLDDFLVLGRKFLYRESDIVHDAFKFGGRLYGEGVDLHFHILPYKSGMEFSDDVEWLSADDLANKDLCGEHLLPRPYVFGISQLLLRISDLTCAVQPVSL